MTDIYPILEFAKYLFSSRAFVETSFVVDRIHESPSTPETRRTACLKAFFSFDHHGIITRII